MDTENKSLHELMQEAAQKIEKAPEEKKNELKTFLTGYLTALEQILPKTA